MKTKLYILTMLFAVFGMFVISACGNDDTNDEEPTLTGNTDDYFPPVVYNPEVIPESGVMIQYSLFNQNGERTKVFKYGDDIIFDISIHNITDDIVRVQGERDSRPTLFPTPFVTSRIKNGIFCVYTDKGNFVGYPYDPNAMDGVSQTMELQLAISLRPYAKYPEASFARWTASWLGKEYDGFMSGRIFKYWQDGVDNKPLKAGNYYTEFDVNLTTRVKKTVRIDFTVTE